MIFGIDSQTGFQRSPSLFNKKLNLNENKGFIGLCVGRE
jgi:hypothetical protein